MTKYAAEMATINKALEAAHEAAKATGETVFGGCGFAWVNVKPGTCRMARALKESGLGRTDPYYGGVTVWDPSKTMTQNVLVKEAGARAFAKVLQETGVDARAASRLD